MIARTWHGVVPRSRGDEYYRYLQETGLKEYREAQGHRGTFVLRRDEGDRTHFLLLTWWESYDAIRAFAGRDFARAVYYPRDREFLLELEPTVTHYEILEGP